MNHDPHDGHRVGPRTESVDEVGPANDHPDATPDAPNAEGVGLDLDALEQDLADVETALERLDAGTYWTDEVTGATIPDEQLAANPVTRRADGGPPTS